MATAFALDFCYGTFTCVQARHERVSPQRWPMTVDSSKQKYSESDRPKAGGLAEGTTECSNIPMLPAWSTAMISTPSEQQEALYVS